MHQVTVDEAQNQLPNLVDEAVSGETIYIIGHDERVVQLVPVVVSGRPRFGSAAGLVSMTDDFDSPLEDFREYMQ